jgi:VWFA-related protein
MGLNSATAQSRGETISPTSSASPAKPVIIPLTIRVKGQITPSELELQTVDMTVNEDGDPQTILSIRAMGTSSPINLMILIQDDVVSSIGLEIKSLAEFIRRLPRGSRVSVGYLRTGSLQVRQKFTNDLEKAAASLRGPIGVASVAPYNPYVEVIEASKRFDAQPAGRRAILLVSDGLDVSHGFDSSGPMQSLDLQRAITEAQRRSVAVYSFYAPAALTTSDVNLISNAQSSLKRLSDETGGRAFFQGFAAPTSFDPFIKELNSALDRQIALTYLSTHLSKGFHRVKIASSTPGVEINYPTGYKRWAAVPQLLLNCSWQERAATVSGSGPTIRKSANHPMKMYFTTCKNDDDVPRMILGIAQFKPHNRGLAIRLLDGFIGECVRVNAIGLGIVSCSLLVWHVISSRKKAGSYCRFPTLLKLIRGLLFLKVTYSANSS